VLILPGSKQTLDDLQWIRDRGFAAAVANHSGMIIGICGGFQMLGLSIDDPEGVESGGLPRTVTGLGRLPVHTIMRGSKTVSRAKGRIRLWEAPRFSGYEIHMGETVYENDAEPFAEIVREGSAQATRDGAACSAGRVWGTYVHGLFDDDAFRHAFLRFARGSWGLTPPSSYVCVTAERGARINRWADHLRQSLDMRLIRGWAGV
jgi:adenosylcobyric acid synthase